MKFVSEEKKKKKKVVYVDSILLFRLSFVHASPVWFGLVLWAVGVALITLDHVLFTF